MPKIKAVITNYDLVTAYGRGIQPLWEGILSGKSCINECKRFSTAAFNCHNAAIITRLSLREQESLVMQMLRLVLNANLNIIPKDALLFLATTAAEVDLTEKAVLNKTIDQAAGKPGNFLKKVQGLLGLKREGLLISCACASSSTAIAEASRMIQTGQSDCCAVIAADAVTEFVFSGFSSLMALDKDQAKPFDKNRSGLSLGEAAGFILLMSQARAKKEKRPALAQVAGWGLCCDANHMTGPSRNAEGLIQVITSALKQANITSDEIGCISSHGTGTLYNDAMEMLAFKTIFKKRPLPVYSIKGGTGHTLGAAGLIETIVALKAQQEKIIPPTVGLKEPDPLARGWVSADNKKLEHPAIILNNCGFGGINAALVLKHFN
jgi:3-oxoacyl-[acyl-carrier-protein] synthase II